MKSLFCIEFSQIWHHFKAYKYLFIMNINIKRLCFDAMDHIWPIAMLSIYNFLKFRKECIIQLATHSQLFTFYSLSLCRLNILPLYIYIFCDIATLCLMSLLLYSKKNTNILFYNDVFKKIFGDLVGTLKVCHA